MAPGASTSRLIDMFLSIGSSSAVILRIEPSLLSKNALAAFNERTCLDRGAMFKF
jgi:hypothetical protein